MNKTFSKRGCGSLSVWKCVQLCALVWALAIAPFNHIFAQSNANSTKKIVMYSGTVVDNEDLPLVGVNVVVKGSKPIVGTTTDLDGNFKISMPNV